MAIETAEPTTNYIHRVHNDKNADINKVPGAVKIIHWTADHKFILDEAALEGILFQNNIKENNVVVVSVAGAFRKGKSFILDFFLRYMRSKYAYKDNLEICKDWLGPDDLPLNGFSWRGGAERDTTGILMWSEVFLAVLPTGEEVAILLLDTQGTFDSDSTVRDCATVFGLSAMISSIQVYNLSQNIQEDDLQHLQFFTEYGRLALNDTGSKPFQKLQFLVRDWSFPYDAEYGDVGGRKILDKRLRITENQHSELQSVRKHIRSCFSEIHCFLMPHPGLKVATNPNFDGKLSDIEADFKTYLKKLVPLILAPENLILKEMNGQKVKVKELLQYFRSYMTVYSGDELPEPKSMLLATAEANNLAAVAAAKEIYNSQMESVCGGTKPFVSPELLQKEHARIKLLALHEFSKKKKMGGNEFSMSFKTNLDSDLEKLYSSLKLQNDSKNIFNTARTPVVFIIMSLGFYLLSNLFGLLGLYNVANISYLLCCFSLLTLLTWVYVRYSGEMCAVGNSIDEVAIVFWENLMKPSYEAVTVNNVDEVRKNL